MVFFCPSTSSTFVLYTFTLLTDQNASAHRDRNSTDAVISQICCKPGHAWRCATLAFFAQTHNDKMLFVDTGMRSKHLWPQLLSSKLC